MAYRPPGPCCHGILDHCITVRTCPSCASSLLSRLPLFRLLPSVSQLLCRPLIIEAGCLSFPLRRIIGVDGQVGAGEAGFDGGAAEPVGDAQIVGLVALVQGADVGKWGCGGHAVWRREPVADYADSLLPSLTILVPAGRTTKGKRRKTYQRRSNVEALPALGVERSAFLAVRIDNQPAAISEIMSSPLEKKVRTCEKERLHVTTKPGAIPRGLEILLDASAYTYTRHPFCLVGTAVAQLLQRLQATAVCISYGAYHWSEM